MDESPLRFLFGHGSVERVEAVYAERLCTWDATRALTERADHSEHRAVAGRRRRARAP